MKQRNARLEKTGQERDLPGRGFKPRLKRRRARARLYREPEADRRSRLVRLALRCCGLLIVVSVIALTSLFAYFYWHYSQVVDARLEQGYLTSRAGIYAAPRVLRAGQRLKPERLADSLRRAGYVDAGAAGRVWSGRFRAESESIIIEPSIENASSSASFSRRPREVRVAFDQAGRIAELMGDGVTLESYALEPEPLADETELRSTGHESLTFQELPDTLVRAILSTEDRRFFEHGGIDLWGIMRAAISWGENDELRQGGSTVTQQLVKNTYLTPERTLRRKFHEAVIASVIERRLSKEEILALYCNEIYLGQRGGVAVRGVRQAARLFFGKELKDLTLSESAAIAGMIQSPARYAPDRHPEEARVRRDTVLAAMLRDGAVEAEDVRAASTEPLNVAPFERRDAAAAYFVDYVNRFVESRDASGKSDGQPVRVHTTLDLDLQRAAEEAVGAHLARLEKVLKRKGRPQASLVALDPRDGRVLAMVGGASYAESQLNRATDARRQPGSVFKPVVYAAAMEAGLSPLSISLDAPREFLYDRRAVYRPANYGSGYTNRDVTMREALVRSLNVVTVDAAMRTGLTRVASLAEKLGMARPEAYPSLALGTTEATPLEVATAYTAFAAGGRMAKPTPLMRVEGGAYEFNYVTNAEQVLRPSTSYMLTDMLGAVVERGTARAARSSFNGVAVAGKTGTSRDGWFAGYTPNMVCVVWVGYDDNSELGLSGADSALPIWTEFVRRAVEMQPELGGAEFARPQAITTIEIDPETGARAHASCPRRERVALTPAFVPALECLHHHEPFDVMIAEAPVIESAPLSSAGSSLESGPLSSSTSRHDAAHAPRRNAALPTLSTQSGASASVGLQPASRPDAYDAPSTRATRTEIGRDGRSRLTNDLRPATGDELRRD